MNFWNFIGEFLLFRWLFGKRRPKGGDSNIPKSIDKSLDKSIDRESFIADRTEDKDLDLKQPKGYYHCDHSFHDDFDNCDYDSLDDALDCDLDDQFLYDFHDEHDDYDMMDDF